MAEAKAKKMRIKEKESGQAALQDGNLTNPVLSGGGFAPGRMYDYFKDT